ncbi:AMP-binding protein [Actinomadura parmotrematis]|uniref:Long-chain fatty acid--CoA ligase n=1 Tax=Actinomadura parmotrematis TaxID=2864039 RepID=A0ABS7FQ81_9ACTN|nr:AMP-binding protein [Actinomadura parmotrematis]MBW8482548.1 long-chain fatty acid--CoA ligase [Actinomadura parmotrematis]
MLDGSRGPAAVSDTTVTEAVLAAAREHAARRPVRPALMDPAHELGYARFAEAVPAAATGLRRLGVRPGDVAAVHLGSACELALAVHAVSAAGAVPAPLPVDASVAALGAMMTETGARFLITGVDTAARSVVATERSYVRQVFSFGNVPGAIPFARLVEAGAPAVAPDPGPGPVAPADPLRDLALLLCDPPDGITHAERFADLYRLGGAIGLAEGDVLACSPFDVSQPTWIALIDLCLAHGAALAAVPEPGTDALLAAIGEHRASVAVVTPAKLRALVYDHARMPLPGVRLLVTGAPDPEVVQACRTRHGWTAATLG